MFLVGATGQLLTLILTIGLPIVFLFSGHHKVELAQNFSTAEVRLNVVSGAQIEKNSFVIDFIDCEEIYKQQINLGLSQPDKNSFAVFPPVWISLWINSSGNKAPPAFA